MQSIDEKVEATRNLFNHLMATKGPEHPDTIAVYKEWTNLQSAAGWTI